MAFFLQYSLKTSTLKKTKTHPNFVLGLASFLVLIIGVLLRGNNYTFADYILLAAIAMGAVHWIWAIIDVLTRHHLNSKSRPFWLIIVMLIPPIGGMIYYLMPRKNVSI